MATQKLTLNLPEEIFHHLARIAELTHQTIESLTVQSIKSNLPPTVENAPLEMQATLQAMQTLSVDNDERENLAAACYRCNEFKGAKTEGIDPATGVLVPLFNPRLQIWKKRAYNPPRVITP